MNYHLRDVVRDVVRDLGRIELLRASPEMGDVLIDFCSNRTTQRRFVTYVSRYL